MLRSGEGLPTDPWPRRNRHIAGIEGGRIDGLARLAVAPLDDIVLGRVELKLEHVAGGGGDAVWLEDQTAVAHADDVRGGICEGQDEDEYH